MHEAADAGVHQPSRGRIGFDRLDVLLVLTFLIVVGPWVARMTANPAARYALTAAIVEQGTVRIDDYEPLLQSNDFVEIDGRYYSDKAPAQPLLGVPVLALAEGLGVPEGTEHRVTENLGLWSQTLVFATIPGALLLPLMRRHARRYCDDRRATLAAVGVGCTTMLLVFSSNLFSHVFVAFLTFLAWHLITGNRLPRASHLVVPGTLVAIAAVSEYPTAAVALILGVWLLWHRGVATAAVFSRPVVVAGAGILAWNRALYGSAASSYQEKADSGFVPLRPPRLDNIIQIFFGDRGFVFTPILLLAVAGLVAAVWRRRRHTVVPAAVFAFVFLLQSGWGNPWGGGSVGPRYMLVALPFLAYPLADILFRERERLAYVLAGIGALAMGLALITLEVIPDDTALIRAHLRNLDQLGVNPSIFTMGLGPLGWLVHAGLAVAAVRAVARAWPRVATTPSPQPSVPQGSRLSSHELHHRVGEP